MRTVGNKVNLKLFLVYEYRKYITTCHFLKKEGTLDNGMRSFRWKYSDGLNQNLNPRFELNPSKKAMLDVRLLGQCDRTTYIK